MPAHCMAPEHSTTVTINRDLTARQLESMGDTACVEQNCIAETLPAGIPAFVSGGAQGVADVTVEGPLS